MLLLRKLTYLMIGLTTLLISFDAGAQHQEKIKSNSSPDSCLPFRMRETILPVALLAYGSSKPIVSAIGRIDRDLRDKIATRHPSFRYRADDWLQWAPSASVYAMDAAGVKTKHRFKDHLLLDAGSILITGGAGYVMRRVSEQIKGFEIVDTQFPSGHTANAFRGAEILRQELSGRHPLLQWSGYLVAGLVAGSRLMRGEHYLSEVVAGAGLGILSTKITYGLFHRIKRPKKGMLDR
jgi:membrane-associated phospholipid phosphatase